jgi:3-oxoacyl-[acyl-carrier protein] reductase
MTPGSVAIVTGASQGIGRATAVRLARDFAALVLVARNPDGLEAAATAVRCKGAEATTQALDLGEQQAAQVVIDQTMTRYGRIDALLNIAGAVPQINLFAMTDAQWDAGLAVKLHGARRLTARAWDALKASRGSVVFMSGTAALDPTPASAAVAAINAAITALAKAFAEQGITDGVQVNSILPGAVMTERRRAFFEQWAPAHGMTVDAAIAAFPARVGTARLGSPEEIADLMAYLVSPAAKWMTGAAVRIDGGEIKGV